MEDSDMLTISGVPNMAIERECFLRTWFLTISSLCKHKIEASEMGIPRVTDSHFGTAKIRKPAHFYLFLFNPVYILWHVRRDMAPII